MTEAIILKSWKIIRIVLVLFLLYIIIGGIVPYIFNSNTKNENTAFSNVDYNGNSESGADKVLLIENKDEAFGARIQMIREADASLDIACYTFQNGITTKAYFNELLKAADRGVNIRILLDGKIGCSSAAMRRFISALTAHPCITAKGFNPINFFKPWTMQVFLHDKFILADNKYLILGGRNMGDRYYKPSNYKGDLTDDRDVLVWRKVVNDGAESVLPQVKDYMELIWNKPETKSIYRPMKDKEEREKLYVEMMESSQELELKNTAYYKNSFQDYLSRSIPTKKISLVYNPVSTAKKNPWVGRELIRIALQAKRTILVQTPYATANGRLLRIMKQVKKSLQSAVLQTNSLASSPNFPAFSNYYTQRKRFLGTGFDIYEYQNRDSIHGKSFCVDSRLSAVGSFNLDDRSFYINTENMLIIDSEEFAQVLTGAIKNYQSQSLRVNSVNEYESSENIEAVPWARGKKAMMCVVSVFSRMFHFII